eukprot:CAMPEP_0116904090 /NCGR_PEP_ID=MMETSP0467-20121206/11176_1 /TAXON_ID=283647 /ORGANISM="Mesodinium pulex, Strain SPMC105" /LENGTH=32 /DNA_ID= /DNA_START= /DNA_END= /DNA_ORIENTATION=
MIDKKLIKNAKDVDFLINLISLKNISVKYKNL